MKTHGRCYEVTELAEFRKPAVAYRIGPIRAIVENIHGFFLSGARGKRAPFLFSGSG
jgi:hypothetical protein